MAILLSDELKESLLEYLKKTRQPELVSSYLFYVEKKFQMHPVIYLLGKIVYESQEMAISQLEKEGKIWRETEIKIAFSREAVNEQTKKIYICPFTGKVFGDNTHPDPQDAIYEWVSKCPENTERTNGLRVKRFYVSEDPEVIKNYIEKRKEPIAKTVYSSVNSGKLFNTKESVVRDFKKNYIKPVVLAEVQNKYDFEPSLLAFVQKQLAEEKLMAFVEALADEDEFAPYVSKWVESEE